MSYLTVHDQLDTRLLATAGLPAFYPESVSKTAVNGQKWCRSTLIPAKTNQMTLGPNGFESLKGIYQIDLFYPMDSDTKYTEMYTMIDAIQDMFKPGLQLSGVRIMNHYARASGQIQTMYSMSVLVEWEFYKTK